MDTKDVERVEKLPDGSYADKDSAYLEDVDTKRMTRRILFMLDVRIVPMLAVLFLVSFLDRTNVGNAKVLGLLEDVNLSNDQYSAGLAIFYAFYIAAELPSNLVLKRLTPRVWLSFLTIAWGIIGMCLGFVRNYAGFLTVRAFLGLAEGGLLPGMVLYMSSLYTRQELGLRIGLFYTTASLSGAFGGLLARGLSSIPTTATVDAGWRWIM
jgi:MFS family permease